MTVKEKRGRRRYIVFRVPEITKTALITVMNRTADPPYVVQCGGGYAILRCGPADRAAVISMVEELIPGSVSVLTSGTLKALRRRIPELERSR